MKTVASCVFALAFILFVIDWALMGLKLLDGDYDIVVGAYIGMGCLLTMLTCAVYKAWRRKCPHCGKRLQGKGTYCSHCGRKL